MESPQVRVHLEQTNANNVKLGSYVMIKGQPCKLMEKTHVKPGKHGSAKCCLIGKSLLTGNNVEETKGSAQFFYTFKPARQTYELSFLDGQYLDCLDSKNCQRLLEFTREDSQRFPDLHKWIEQDEQVSIQTVTFPKATSEDASSSDDLEMCEVIDDIRSATTTAI
jgi:translation elongation factor P/translation initiation factor 5A